MSVENTEAESGGKGASLALAVIAVGNVVLTALTAKAAAVLSGTLSLFGAKEILLNGLLVAGFGYVCYRVRAGRSCWLAAVLCGAVMWRAAAVLFDVVTALGNARLGYWSASQLAVTAVLVSCGLLALLAMAWLPRSRD